MQENPLITQVIKISEKKSIEYKFCHTADWHLDYFQYQKKERWYDFFTAANECTKLMIKEKPDFVIHCGDLFHQFRPTPGAVRLAIRIFEKFKQANIPFYVIRGNHDASKAQAQRFGGTILKLLEDLEYLHYIQDETIPINDHINFTGIGEYGKTTGDVIEEVMRNNPLDTSKFNILALHGYLQGQVSDSIFDISGYQLASLGFNYIALGHYHKVWEEKENNIYCPGSTEQTSLNDWGKPDEDGFFRKSGCYSVKVTLNQESNTWNMKVKRKEFDVRPKGRFSFRIKENLTLEELIEKANTFVKKHEQEGAIIRFDFIGELPLGKQSLVNFTKLPAIKDSKALHIIPNQDISSIMLDKAKAGLTSEEAIVDLLKSQGYKSTAINRWLDLANETIKTLGQKIISSEEKEEIKSIYDLITEASSKIADSEIKGKSNNPSGKSKKKASKKSNQKVILANNQELETKDTKQSNLASFLKEGD